MSPKNTDNKKNETVDPKATEPETVADPQPAAPQKSDAPTEPEPKPEPQELGLEALDFDNLVPSFTSDPEAPVDRNENVFQRAVKVISNGVRTQTRPMVDELGDILKNPENDRPLTEPLDPNQCQVWQSRYKAAGRIQADIEFPNNSGAERFQQLCSDQNRVILYTIHRTLLDSEGNPKPLPSDSEKNQHGHYMLVIILPQAYKIKDSNNRMVPDPAGSPRDQFLRNFKESIPEFPLDCIGKGEMVFKHLINNTPADHDWDPNKKDNQVQRDNQTYPQTGVQKTQDLSRRLTVPSLPGDRKKARPEDMIFLRAASGFDQLYINRQTNTKRDRNRQNIQIEETKTVGNAPDILGVLEN